MLPIEVNEYGKDEQWNVGQRIQDMRTRRKMKASDIAAYLNIGTNQYSRIENGRANCTIPQMYVLAQLLECSVDYLLFGKEPMLSEQQKLALDSMLNAFGRK